MGKEFINRYLYFDDYSVDEVDLVISTLSDDEIVLLELKERKKCLEKTKMIDLYGILLPKINKALIQNRRIHRYQNYLFFDILKNIPIEQIVPFLSLEEIVIVSLYLGYIKERCFSEKEISNFLGLSINEVHDVLQKICHVCEEKKSI